jgi:hypothetical protein
VDKERGYKQLCFGFAMIERAGRRAGDSVAFFFFFYITTWIELAERVGVRSLLV